MLQRLYSTLFWIFLTVSSIVLFPVAVLIWAVTWPFDRRRVLLHRFTCFWASLYTWFNPAWPVRVTGRERVRPRSGSGPRLSRSAGDPALSDLIFDRWEPENGASFWHCQSPKRKTHWQHANSVKNVTIMCLKFISMIDLTSFDTTRNPLLSQHQNGENAARCCSAFK